MRLVRRRYVVLFLVVVVVVVADVGFYQGVMRLRQDDPGVPRSKI